VRFLQAVVEQYDHIYLTISDNAVTVIQQELGITIDKADSTLDAILGDKREKVELLSPDDMCASPASGSVEYDGLVIIPCSMGTAGRIAAGVSNDLITRTADVCLKERRKLILVVRETPMSLIHLCNLTALAEAGAIILPASPAFYHRPVTVDDMVAFIVGRALQQLGLQQELVAEWKRLE
jgi:4-hydroxy-3-polyprenylbenzoate decarboxylase